jgi:hypothetical protein
MRRLERGEARVGDTLLVDDPSLADYDQGGGNHWGSWDGQLVVVIEIARGSTNLTVRREDGRETTFFPGRFIWPETFCPECGQIFELRDDYICPSCREVM